MIVFNLIQNNNSAMMKFKILAAATLLATFSAASIVRAEPAASNAEMPFSVAGLFDNVIPSSGSGSDADADSGSSSAPPSGDRDATGTQAFRNFSGQTQAHQDSFNGFSINVPVEFQLNGKGATTNWTGPLLVGKDSSGDEFTGSGLISVNTVEWAAGDPTVACNATVSQYTNDRFYPNDKLSKKQVKFGTIPATVVRFEESIYQRGTRDEKNADDHHRMHFQVCGNGRIYNGTLGYYYGFFKRNDVDVRAVFEAAIQSFKLIPADNSPIGG